MSNAKPYHMRVKVLDGQPREPNKLKGKLVPHVDVVDANNKIEFVICAVKPGHLDQVRAKLVAAGLEEVVGGDITVSIPGLRPACALASPPRGTPSPQPLPRSTGPDLREKPYGFVQLPDTLTTKPPVWHDGTGAKGRLSGELRCEIETLTPLLVGWERRQTDDTDEPWPVPHAPTAGDDLDAFVQRAARQAHPDVADQSRQRAVERARQEYANRVRDRGVAKVAIGDVGRTIASKSVLCPLRAPWGERSVILPGDSIKGLMRHELGALLGAPMERVAERSYSYRPNSLYPNQPNARLIPRLARVPDDGVEMRDLCHGVQVRVPTALDLLPANLRYDRNHTQGTPRYRFDPAGGGGAAYRGGMGAGERLNAKRKLHARLDADPDNPVTRVAVPEEVRDGYLNTLRHLTDLSHGHFGERHPDVPNTVKGDDARSRILQSAAGEAFSAGDLVWVEWDTRKDRIVSLGWHYYYRWAYADTVRWRGRTEKRHGLFPLPQEEGAVPAELSPVRRLFGYAADNEGSAGIGKGDHAQLMGRLSVNAAFEVIKDGDTEQARFLPPTFLRELGMPRPSAVEHYLEQPYHPKQRPSDRATLVTYGDAAGYDAPGKLAGRKSYLDRADAYTGEPWKDESEANRLNDRSTLVLDASRPGRRFRFTVRFRDLDPDELASVLLALCPHQFRGVAQGEHGDGYCSKLGYARPLGWGTVRIEAKEMHVLKQEGGGPRLDREADIRAWFQKHFQRPPMLSAWLDVHRHKHPAAADYPRRENGEIYTFHTGLRADHTRQRRYEREGGS